MTTHSTHSPREVRVAKKYRFPWYMPWRADNVSVKPGSEVIWRLENLDYLIWFPSGSNPLDGSNEITSKPDGTVTARVKSTVKAGQKYYYCILIRGEDADVVEGECSPPEMEIG